MNIERRAEPVSPAHPLIGKVGKLVLFVGCVVSVGLVLAPGAAVGLVPTLPGGPPPRLPGAPTGPQEAQQDAGRNPLLEGAMPASAHANKLFKLILSVSDYDGPPIMFLATQSSEVQNACATFLKPSDFAAGAGAFAASGKAPPAAVPAILYNPTFMTQMTFAADNNKYVGVYVLAHELGHIVKGHVDPANPLAASTHPWQKELEADRYAGRILAKLGASPKELQGAHRIMVATRWIRVRLVDGKPALVFADKQMRVNDLIAGSTTHPDAVKRIHAIAQGWREGGGEGEVEEDLARIFVEMVKEVTEWEPGM